MSAVLVVAGFYLTMVAAALPGWGATFTVNSTDDVEDATPGDGHCETVGGDCTLRAAVQESNKHTGPDTIVLPAGKYVLSGPVGAPEDEGKNGDLDIRDDGPLDADGYNLKILGQGAQGDSATIIDGNHADRIVHVVAGRVLIADVMIQNGDTTIGYPTSTDNGSGGGVYVDKLARRLRLVRTVIKDNTSRHHGGGIYNDRALVEIMSSSVIGNHVRRHQCESNCSSPNPDLGGQGGGVDNNCGTLDLRNSTISGNDAEQQTGGIANGKGLLANATIADNTGNGLSDELFGRFQANVEHCGESQEPRLLLRNSIVVGDCRGRVISGGYNVLGRDPAGSRCTFAQQSTDKLGVEPKLDPELKDNGGEVRTLTRALLPGSPAIDGGNPAVFGSADDACEATDQRGVERPRDGDGNGTFVCDAGAFEAPGRLPPIHCSDGILVVGEQCDEGSANGDGSCCDEDCRLKPAGQVCRAAGLGTLSCDTDERCDGRSPICPPNDAVALQGTRCDDQDPCTEKDTCIEGRCSGLMVCAVHVDLVARVVRKGGKLHVKRPKNAPKPFRVACHLTQLGEVGSCTAQLEVSEPGAASCVGAKRAITKGFDRNGNATIWLGLNRTIRRKLKDRGVAGVNVCAFVHRIGSSITVIKRQLISCPEDSSSGACEVAPELAGGG